MAKQEERYSRAPVLIPTCNRVEHLRRCIESLERCTGADQTEVFVSVDAPPSERYTEGHDAVVAYLSDKRKSHRFLALHVFNQEDNLGPARNNDFLKGAVRGRSDRYISTEDDNDFAPNFLEYANKGLELFGDDPRVMAICGCKETDWVSEPGSNVVALKMYPPYGTAHWFSKDDRVVEECREVLLAPEMLGSATFKRLKREDRTLFNLYVLNVLLSEEPPFWVDGELSAIDTVRSLLTHVTDMFCIIPMTGKSRTWGNDGSGVNMGVTEGVNPKERWPLDNNCFFEYVLDGEELKCSENALVKGLRPLEENGQIENEYMKSARSIKSNLFADFGLLLLRLNGYDCFKSRSIMSAFAKMYEHVKKITLAFLE